MFDFARYTYKNARRAGYSPAKALQLVREHKLDGKSRAPSPSFIEYAPASDGLRWAEYPEKGLRFVGFADQIARIDHNGWYTDENGFEGYAGVVYRLPSRAGNVGLVAGYAEVTFGGKGRSLNNEGARLDFSSIYDDEKEAARAADSIAERESEREREYQEAYRAGARWQHLGEELAANRRELLAVLAERKAAPFDKFPALLRSIDARINALLEQREEMQRERAKISECEIYAPLRVAWRDGAGAA